VESDPRYPSLLIYPEGTQTNGDYLVGFKKGAFAGLMTVQPIIIKYKWKQFSPTWEGIPFLQHTHIMCCSTEGFEIEVWRLPPFKPNDHLFETHKDKGKEKWEIFAWAVR